MYYGKPAKMEVIGTGSLSGHMLQVYEKWIALAGKGIMHILRKSAKA